MRPPIPYKKNCVWSIYDCILCFRNNLLTAGIGPLLFHPDGGDPRSILSGTRKDLMIFFQSHPRIFCLPAPGFAVSSRLFETLPIYFIRVLRPDLKPLSLLRFSERKVLLAIASNFLLFSRSADFSPHQNVRFVLRRYALLLFPKTSPGMRPPLCFPLLAPFIFLSETRPVDRNCLLRDRL